MLRMSWRPLMDGDGQWPNGTETANQVTESVIGCAYRVHNALGYGFLERVYENALAHEIRKNGMSVEQQRRIEVRYDGVTVGEYLADLVVEHCAIVEIKAAKAIDDAHIAQGLNYLAATGLPVCLLLNFAGKVQVKRLVSNQVRP